VGSEEGSGASAAAEPEGQEPVPEETTPVEGTEPVTEPTAEPTTEPKTEPKDETAAQPAPSTPATPVTSGTPDPPRRRGGFVIVLIALLLAIGAGIGIGDGIWGSGSNGLSFQMNVGPGFIGGNPGPGGSQFPVFRGRLPGGSLPGGGFSGGRISGGSISGGGFSGGGPGGPVTPPGPSGPLHIDTGTTTTTPAVSA